MSTVKIIRQAEQTTSEWSGGTTTQLAIFPPTGNYARREFLWRLSSATVNVAESSFTALPGFKRILMILSGTMSVRHEGHHEVLLHAFEQDSFDGGWTTTSFGQAVDFNLMTGSGASGELLAIALGCEEETAISPAAESAASQGQTTLALYVFSGSAQAGIGGEAYALNEKDVLLLSEDLTPKETRVLLAAGPAGARIIQARINY